MTLCCYFWQRGNLAYVPHFMMITIHHNDINANPVKTAVIITIIIGIYAELLTNLSKIVLLLCTVYTIYIFLSEPIREKHM